MGCDPAAEALSPGSLCGRGGIGRRAGLKIRFRKECRFDPDRPHQSPRGERPTSETGKSRPRVIILRSLRLLYVQVLVAIVLGIAIGFLWPEVGVALKPLADAFVRLIKMV